jgi:hypothetical protein
MRWWLKPDFLKKYLDKNDIKKKNRKQKTGKKQKQKNKQTKTTTLWQSHRNAICKEKRQRVLIVPLISISSMFMCKKQINKQ